MYTISVEASFTATHQLQVADGAVEPRHEHRWLVRAHFSRSELDDLDMVVDFSKAQAGLNSIVAGLQRISLDNHEELRKQNPTAEAVARYVFEQLRKSGFPGVRRVEVTETPGCVAAYERTQGSLSSAGRDFD